MKPPVFGFPLCVLCVLCGLSLCGCGTPAEQRLDYAFRSRVGEIDGTLQNSYSDSHSGVTDTSSAGISLKLRDPSKDGLTK